MDSGGKIRTCQMLRELMKSNFVTYLSLCEESIPEAIRQKACEYSHEQVWIPWRETPKGSPAFFWELGVNLLASGLPYVIDKYRSKAMTAAIGRLAGTGRYDIVVCDFLTPTVHLMGLGKALPAKTLLFQHNVESQIWKRLSDNARGLVGKAYFKEQWRRMAAFERDRCAAFDGVVGVSEEDCRHMREVFGLGNVMGSVPTGVDVAYFQGATAAKKPGSIVFLGSMDWMANIDGVAWFAEQMFPSIKARIPGACLSVVGRNPTARVRELAKGDPAIEVTGTVEDVRPYVAAAEVVVVPLRVGSGTRIKIFEAMAAGIPVVSTRIGAEGLPVEHGRDILLADEPADFISCVERLLRDPQLRARIGASGLELVRANFGWEPVTKVFENYCAKLLTARP